MTNPAGSAMYNYLRPIVPGILGVYFTPAQSGTHLVNVSFNSDVVAGQSVYYYYYYKNLTRSTQFKKASKHYNTKTKV